MLADVMKQRQLQRNIIDEAEIAKYNHPYKRDTIIYFEHLYKLGGIQTWILNLAQHFEFSLVYDNGDKERIEYLESMGIECIRYVGQSIECNTLVTCIFGNPAKIKAKKTILAIHGDYKALEIDTNKIPAHDEAVAVSKLSADSWYEVTGEKPKVIYNEIKIYDTIKPLIIGVFSRMSKEKGRWRVELLAERLIQSGKPFIMIIFSDFKLDINDNRIIQFEPIMNTSGWMSKCDYVCQLSDTEAGCLTIQEALKMGKSIIVTKLPLLKELKIDESNAKILEFDMSNLDIDDLWNIPVVKNWKEPISEGWEEYMKKKVFREKYDDFLKWAEENGATKAIIFEPATKGDKLLEKTVIDIEPKKTTRKKKAEK